MTAEDKAKLRTSFPVSSGTQHRKEEPNEWVPVQPEEASKPVFTEPEQQEEDVCIPPGWWSSLPESFTGI